jgi:quercetin dioxygenase-like cupin family protein
MEAAARQPELRNIITLPGTGRAEKVLAVTHSYLLEAQQSGGALAIVELVVPPGHGIPPHTHRLEDESFYVIDGELQIVGDDLPGPTRLPKGALFFGPRGRLHGFTNPTQTPSRVLVLLTPGGNMQAMFSKLAALTSSVQGMPKPEDVKTLCAAYDIIFA